MDERIEVADILLRYEKLDMALEVLEELREEFPNEKDVYYKLAKVYEKKGFFDKSLENAVNIVVGANKLDYHIKNFNFSRDLGQKIKFDDIS